MLSRQLALEWAADGIRSNVINPGMILTPLSASMYDRPGVAEARTQAIPSGRIGLPEDILGAVLYLASPGASYVNGAEITVDGGYTRNVMGLVPRAGY
jgi:NAD(P)-dependent dehydrogenase (short-subunit alcohol dehydrogenase family)